MGKRNWTTRAGGFLGRLRRDARGNTLALAAAMLLPLLGFSGSAIDMARLYVVKVRLQQACDAGVLAGRKAMTDTSPSTTLDSGAVTQAQAFFKNNFTEGWYNTSAVTFTPAKAVDGTNSSVANAVYGQASATVPMAVMRVFGIQQKVITVDCRAHYDLADTDVMFVLDTTGSMSCTPSDPDTCGTSTSTYQRDDKSYANYNPEKSGSKLEALRQAVLLFDQTIRSNADPSTHFRYGFVPYSSAVNVGGLVPSQYLERNQWYYQTRTLNAPYKFVTSATAVYPVTAADCSAKRAPSSGYANTNSYVSGGNAASTGFFTYFSFSGSTSWSNSNGGTCTGSATGYEAYWHYGRQQLSTTSFAATSGSNATVTDPTRLDGSTSRWDGCIEELDTTASSSFDLDNLPADLNPDTIPSGSSGYWRPMWPDVEWLRDTYGTEDVLDKDVGGKSNGNTGYSWDYGASLGQLASCPKAAQRLQVMTAQQVKSYLYSTDFKPSGGTYHDYGLTWGARLMSPNGVFAADTAAWPGRNAPSRNIIFVTDGTMSPNYLSYGGYGAEILDLRVTGGNTSNDTAYHTARFRAECDYAKSRLGMTIYVVAVGTALNADLQYCASPGQAFQASSTSAVTDAFKSIALRVAKLRITL